jgi:hypothetical protein
MKYEIYSWELIRPTDKTFNGHFAICREGTYKGHRSYYHFSTDSWDYTAEWIPNNRFAEVIAKLTAKYCPHCGHILEDK